MNGQISINFTYKYIIFKKYGFCRHPILLSRRAVMQSTRKKVHMLTSYFPSSQILILLLKHYRICILKRRINV